MHLVWRKTEFRKTVFVQEGLTTSDLRVVTEVPAEVCRQCAEKPLHRRWPKNSIGFALRPTRPMLKCRCRCFVLTRLQLPLHLRAVLDFRTQELSRVVPQPNCALTASRSISPSLRGKSSTNSTIRGFLKPAI